MRLLLGLLLLLSVVSMIGACPNGAYFVNGYWNLTAPSYSIPIDTSAACAASANSTSISTWEHAYYGQYGVIVGTNSTGSPACCPARRVGGAGPCCVGPQPVPAAVCSNFVCAGNGSSSGVGCPAVVAECLELAQYEWVDCGSSTGCNGAAGGGVWSVSAVIGCVVGWMLLVAGM